MSGYSLEDNFEKKARTLAKKRSLSKFKQEIYQLIVSMLEHHLREEGVEGAAIQALHIFNEIFSAEQDDYICRLHLLAEQLTTYKVDLRAFSSILIQSSEIQVDDLKLLTYIYEYFMEGNPFFMSNETLAQKFRTSSSTIKRRKGVLVQAGLLHAQKRGQTFYYYPTEKLVRVVETIYQRWNIDLKAVYTAIMEQHPESIEPQPLLDLVDYTSWNLQSTQPKAVDQEFEQATLSLSTNTLFDTLSKLAKPMKNLVPPVAITAGIEMEAPASSEIPQPVTPLPSTDILPSEPSPRKWTTYRDCGKGFGSFEYEEAQKQYYTKTPRFTKTNQPVLKKRDVEKDFLEAMAREYAENNSVQGKADVLLRIYCFRRMLLDKTLDYHALRTDLYSLQISRDPRFMELFETARALYNFTAKSLTPKQLVAATFRECAFRESQRNVFRKDLKILAEAFGCSEQDVLGALEVAASNPLQESMDAQSFRQLLGKFNPHLGCDNPPIEQTTCSVGTLEGEAFPLKFEKLKQIFTFGWIKKLGHAISERAQLELTASSETCCEPLFS